VSPRCTDWPTGSSGALAQALSAQDLTEEEARALATFLKMYRSGQIG
jgi:hypothetical protein